MNGLEISNLRQKYTAGSVGVHHFNAKCKNGEVLAILAGEEGGKTSLIRCIAGLLVQESGEIVLNGKSIHNKPIKERNVSAILHDNGLIKGKSVKWNLAYPLKIRKTPKDVINNTINSIAEKFKIGLLLSYPISRLKEVDKIRVAFARAFMRDAPLLLIDNPFSNLKVDERRALMLEMLPYIKQYKGVILFATDSPSEAFTLGNQISIFYYGICEQTGSLDDMKKRPASVQVYKYVYGVAANIVKTQLLQENNLPYIMLGDNKINLEKKLLLNDVYIGSEIEAAFLIRPAKTGKKGKLLFSEDYFGSNLAHLSYQDIPLVMTQADITSSDISFEVEQDSIRLYDLSNGKLIY